MRTRVTFIRAAGPAQMIVMGQGGFMLDTSVDPDHAYFWDSPKAAADDLWREDRLGLADLLGEPGDCYLIVTVV